MTKPRSVLEQILSQNNSETKDSNDLNTYLINLKRLLRLCTDSPLDTPQLDALLTNGDYPERLEVDSSYATIDGPEAAMEMANEAATAQYEAIRGELERSKEALIKLQKIAEAVKILYHGLNILRRPSTQFSYIILSFNEVLQDITDEDLKVLMKGKEYHPTLLKHLTEQRNNEYYVPDPSEDTPKLRASYLGLLKQFIDAEMEGIYVREVFLGPKTTIKKNLATRSSDLIAAYKELQSMEDQREEVAAKKITTDTLHPALKKHMATFNGIDVAVENLAIVSNGSSKILRAVISNINFTEVSKKFVIFGMSWDAFKKIPSPEDNLEVCVVDGPVNAAALEKFILSNLSFSNTEPTLDEVRLATREQIGALMLNIPENPLGKIPTTEEMQALADVICKYDISLVIADEIFSVPGYKSISTYEGMAQRTYVVSSTSKVIPVSNHLAYGYTADRELAITIQDIIEDRYPPIESITLAAYAALIDNTPVEYYERNQISFKEKSTYLTRVMNNKNDELYLDDGLKWLHVPDYGCLGVIQFPLDLTKACGINNSCELVEYIYKLSGLQTVPVGDVNPDPSQPLGVRINFSLDNEDLVQVIERMGLALEFMQRSKQYQEIREQSRERLYESEMSDGMPSYLMDIMERIFGGEGDNISIVRSGGSIEIFGIDR